MFLLVYIVSSCLQIVTNSQTGIYTRQKISYVALYLHWPGTCSSEAMADWKNKPFMYALLYSHKRSA